MTFEYSLVKDVNDNLTEAKALARLIKDMHGHVNLIPVNPIKERDYVQSNPKSIQEFKNYLEKNQYKYYSINTGCVVGAYSGSKSLGISIKCI